MATDESSTSTSTAHPRAATPEAATPEAATANKAAESTSAKTASARRSAGGAGQACPAEVRTGWLIGRVLFAVPPHDGTVGDHPSPAAVADNLQRPTREFGRTALEHSLSGLAPGGVCLATTVSRRAGGLLHHRFTLTPAPRSDGGLFSVALIPRVAPGGRYPPPRPVEPGPSSTPPGFPVGDAVARPAHPRDKDRGKNAPTCRRADQALVLRFTWWQVMEQPDYVLGVLSRVYGRALGRAEVSLPLPRRPLFSYELVVAPTVAHECLAARVKLPRIGLQDDPCFEVRQIGVQRHPGDLDIGLCLEGETGLDGDRSEDRLEELAALAQACRATLRTLAASAPRTRSPASIGSLRVTISDRSAASAMVSASSKGSTRAHARTVSSGGVAPKDVSRPLTHTRRAPLRLVTLRLRGTATSGTGGRTLTGKPCAMAALRRARTPDGRAATMRARSESGSPSRPRVSRMTSRARTARTTSCLETRSSNCPTLATPPSRSRAEAARMHAPSPISVASASGYPQDIVRTCRSHRLGRQVSRLSDFCTFDRRQMRLSAAPSPPSR